MLPSPTPARAPFWELGVGGLVTSPTFFFLFSFFFSFFSFLFLLFHDPHKVKICRHGSLTHSEESTSDWSKRTISTKSSGARTQVGFSCKYSLVGYGERNGGPARESVERGMVGTVGARHLSVGSS